MQWVLASRFVVSSPLSEHPAMWQKRLLVHPGQEFAEYILHGIEHGFRVGINYSAKCNTPSALQHPLVVKSCLREDGGNRGVLGPFGYGEIPGLVVECFQRDARQTYYRSVFPEGASVNEEISPDSCTLSYTSIERMARAAVRLGPVALLAKLDIKEAHRLVPVHPDNQVLLAVKWNGAYYVDSMLLLVSAQSQRFLLHGRCSGVVSEKTECGWCRSQLE